MQNNQHPYKQNYYSGYKAIKHGSLKLCLKAKNIFFEGTNNFLSTQGLLCKESEDSLN